MLAAGDARGRAKFERMARLPNVEKSTVTRTVLSLPPSRACALPCSLICAAALAQAGPCPPLQIGAMRRTVLLVIESMLVVSAHAGRLHAKAAHPRRGVGSEGDEAQAGACRPLL